jgi:hypothetical protein
MNKYRIYRLLKQHIKLGERRNPMFERNRSAKYIIYGMVAFWAIYLVVIGVELFFVARSSDDMTGYELIGGMIPFILSLDFLIRFMMTQTPSQMVKPYALLPLPKFACIDCFLINTITNNYNLFWFFLFVPFGFLSIFFTEGFFSFIGFLVGWWLLMLINSQWYLLARTLINQKMSWWLLPAVIYAGIYSPWYLGGKHAFSHFMDLYANISTGFTVGKPLYYIASMTLLIVLFFINRKIQYKLIYIELSKVEQVKMKTVSEFNYFDRFGEIGQYMKLEIKSIMRCKTIRTRFIQSICIVLLFSAILSFSDVYDNSFMINFICIYNFAVFGSMMLAQIMGAEGNYIDGLMIHKENILSLLRAKYFLNCMVMILPLVLMIPTIITGKVTILMAFTYMFMTTGPIYFCFFQLAIYNKQTISLNDKMMGKSGSNSLVQTVIVMGAFFVPIMLYYTLTALCGSKLGLTIMMLIGIVVTLTNSIWIRNIYKRLMVRRYENMEGFRASR